MSCVRHLRAGTHVETHDGKQDREIRPLGRAGVGK